MNWQEARENYPNKWLLFEAIEAYSKDGYRHIDELAIINEFEDGREALKEYSKKHKKNKKREMYVYHTKNEQLNIEERTWIGVRRNG